MCVTTGQADIHGTRASVHATSDGRRIVSYINKARSWGSGPNCMLLNYPGDNLRLVDGPQRTSRLMDDMTKGLPEVVYREPARSFGGGLLGAEVHDYGDYTVVTAQKPRDILDALSAVPDDRRPWVTASFRQMIEFFAEEYPRDTFVLGCFEGRVAPTHPITVSYVPRDGGLLAIPGLDGHDGVPPRIGQLVYRDFTLAFSVEDVDLPYARIYRDSGVAGQLWAPTSVTGFRDNRMDGLNGDYMVPLEAVVRGLSGRELATELVAPL